MFSIKFTYCFFFNEETRALVLNDVEVNFLYIATIYLLTTKNQTSSSSQLWHLWENKILIWSMIAALHHNVVLSEMLSSDVRDLSAARRSLI